MKQFKRCTVHKHVFRSHANSYREYIVFNYVIIVSVFSIILFLYGFFPITYNEVETASKKDIPKFVERTRIKVDEVYKPVVKRLIIMVIDALRWDFVHGAQSSQNMPKTTRLLRNTEASCLYKTKVHTPTVTMPRIKEIATGSVPNFIDVVLNLGAHEIKGDSLLRQCKDQGHKIVFYGDDTWIKLFPRMFYRYEDTSSFFVSDYTEVDFNVTRNIAIELYEKDWSVMILHYLGLDHIGHLVESYNPMIKTKLLEMDEIIDTINTYVSKWNEKGESTLFLVTGDHGMKESGGHGGSTPEETRVPLLAFGRPCTYKENLDDEIDQTDIAPTLSVLLGIPIPKSSLGTIVLNMISELTFSQKLFALYYNAQHLFLQFSKTSNFNNTDTYKTYRDAIKLHSAWLNTQSHPNDMVYDIINMYESAMSDMKNKLTSNLLKYDIHTISIAIIFMAHILFIGISIERPSTIALLEFLTIFAGSYVAWVILNYLFGSETKTATILHMFDSHYLFLNICIFAILVFNCYLCATRTLQFFKLKNISTLEALLPIASLVQAISLSSSSFVEEEHQVWYYYFITLMTLFACKIIRRNAREKAMRLPIPLLILMLTHRVLKELNRCSGRSAGTDDISDWLQNLESSFAMTFILIFALGLLVGLDFCYEQKGSRLVFVLLDVVLAILVYLRHAVANLVYRPNFYDDSRGIVEIHCYWAFTFIYVLFSIHRLAKVARQNNQNFLPITLFSILKLWVIISCLLHRPYNVILVPVQLIVGAMIYDLTKSSEYFNIKVYLYFWSSNVFYFYQGNSNSLSTIDVGAGYIGLESYQPVIIGFFLIVNTYSAQVLGFLMYLCDHALHSPLLTSKTALSLCKQYVFWRIVPISLYMVVMTVLRFHISLWTVFSPKILYEAVHCVVLFTVIFTLEVNFVIYQYMRGRTKKL
ncbi:GPI ethanolamine phosphate transferase 2-like [Copidosoma floridanum]|uniref:GPI ethanolamine phosphate transferase 2-like n=1 Tax=Copidosoma floridanum TaxID=29053 RepID=UPI0006C972C5|nr:GPI ethanolamine phosphate transferase 2-like [Copidosoma floridanum]